MEINQKEVWQKNLPFMKGAVAFSIILAVIFFFLAAMMSVLMQGTGIVTLFRNGYNLIFAIASFTFCVFFLLAYKAIKGENISEKSSNEKASHSKMVKRLQGGYFLFLSTTIIFVGFHCFNELPSQSLAAIVLASMGIVMLGVAVVSYMLVMHVKTNYLN